MLFHQKQSNEVRKLYSRISAGAKVIQLYASKVQNKAVLVEALKVLRSKQNVIRGPDFACKYIFYLNFLLNLNAKRMT